MTEIYKEISEAEIHNKGLYSQEENFQTEFSFNNYRINLDGLDEPNNGRNILKFRLFRNDLEITNEVNNQGYCYPITFPFSDTKSNYIYIPTENKIALINTNTHTIHKFDYPEAKGLRFNFFYDNFLFLVFRNCYLIINLNNLKTDVFEQKNIDFIQPCKDHFLVFNNWFQEVEKRSLINFSTIKTTAITIESKNIYDSSIEEYERKRAESKKGYLWSTGHKNINGSKKIFNIHRWNLVGCDFSKSTIDLGTTIPVTNGNMDEKRTMWFEVENKYIRINIKALVANKV